MTEPTPEEREELRKGLLKGIAMAEAAGPDAMYAQAVIKSNRQMLSLLDALDARERELAEAKTEAWDEGKRAAFEAVRLAHGTGAVHSAGGVIAQNPYRKDPASNG